MHRPNSMIYALTFSVALSAGLGSNAFGEGNNSAVQQKDPGKVGRLVRKMKHPMTNFKAQKTVVTNYSATVEKPKEEAAKESNDLIAAKPDSAAQPESTLEDANVKAAASTNAATDKVTPGKTSDTTAGANQAAVVDTAVGKVAKPSKLDAATAKAANDVPGVNIQAGHMATPLLDDKPIKGFHPIKKIMRPIENIAKQSVILGQNITRLEAPIATLQPSMMGLKDKMGTVDNRMGSMQKNLNSMQGGLEGVRGDMGSVRGDITGVRSDLHGVRAELTQIEDPIKALREPLENVSKPVSTINTQLAKVDQSLNDVKTLLGTVLASIYIAAAAIAFGTPLAAFMVYKNRRKLFPHTAEHDFPTAPAAPAQDTTATAPTKPVQAVQTTGSQSTTKSA